MILGSMLNGRMLQGKWNGFNAPAHTAVGDFLVPGLLAFPVVCRIDGLRHIGSAMFASGRQVLSGKPVLTWT